MCGLRFPKLLNSHDTAESSTGAEQSSVSAEGKEAADANGSTKVDVRIASDDDEMEEMEELHTERI